MYNDEVEESKMENKMKHLLKIIKIGAIIFAIIFFGFLAYSLISKKEMDYFWIMFIGGSIFIIVFTIFVVRYGIKAGKEYRKNLMATKPKKRFKYIDSFYYEKVVRVGSPDETSSKQYFVYHILEDIDSKKTYAIAEQNTNIRFEKALDKTKVLRIDDIDGVTTYKDWKEANYNDKGSFWIDEELTDCYQNDGTNIIIKYFGENHKVKINGELFNRNNNYNVSLLDKSTFITGYAELENK